MIWTIRHSDRRFGTTTLPGGWEDTGLERGDAAADYSFLGVAESCRLYPQVVGATWAKATVVSSMLLRGAAPGAGAALRSTMRFVLEAA